MSMNDIATVVFGLVFIIVLLCLMHPSRKPNQRRVFCRQCEYCVFKCRNKKSDYYGWSALRLREMGNWCDKGKTQTPTIVGK